MSDLSPEQEQYQREYAAAMADMDSAEAGKAPATTTEPVKVEPVVEEPAKPDPEPAKEVATAVDETVETLAELKERLAKAEKALKDTQSWGTKNAQQLAEMRRAQEQAQRDASRPAILDENPDLAEAIKYVANDPAPRQQAEAARATWMQTIEAAHPGIFAVDADPELIDALVKKRDESNGEWDADPMVAIRDIAAEKVAHAQRQTEKRFQVEAAAQKAKSAMSVPGTGGGGKREAVDAQAEEANRFKNMSDAEFDKEVKRVKGF